MIARIIVGSVFAVICAFVLFGTWEVVSAFSQAFCLMFLGCRTH
jgi:hypothetical protein